MYFKLRDEKVNYLRKIYKIIFELEKRKIIDDKKNKEEVEVTDLVKGQKSVEKKQEEYYI